MQQIEETIFSKKRWNPAHMIAYGFQKAGDDYSYTGTFLSGDFQAILSVSAAGVVKGTVIDKMTDDEYAPLRQQSAVGTYVRTVRAAYENWLCQIAASCCDDVLFASDQANRMTEYIRVTYQVLPDFPWSHPAKKATPHLRMRRTQSSKKRLPYRQSFFGISESFLFLFLRFYHFQFQTPCQDRLHLQQYR